MKLKKSFIVYIILILCMLFACTKVEASEYTNEISVAKQIRDNMVNREEIFAINVKLELNKPGNDDIFDQYADKLVEIATSEELANSSSAGDYLRYSWDQYIKSHTGYCIYENSKYTYYLTITYYFNYYTTYSQEQELNKNISKYVKNNIDMAKDSDFTKISKIYSYITKNTSYDTKNEKNDFETMKYTAYGALKNKKAICQGYSTLLYKMLKASDVKNVRIVRSDKHAWNIVKLGRLYYNLDSTWDAKKNNYKYFLKGLKTFENLKNHKMVKEYNKKDFKNDYPISNKDYNINQDKIKILKIKSSAKRKITLEWEKSNNCDGYIIEYSTNSKMKNAKSIIIKNRKTTKKNIKTLKSNKKYYIRIRTYKKISGQKHYSSWSPIKTITVKK